MYTVRKVRNLAKLKDKSEILKHSDILMTLACVLLKKGIIISNQIYNSLKNKINCFNDFFFDKFIQGKDYPKL